MKKLITVLLTAMLLITGSAYAEGNERDAIKAFNAGDYTQAIELFKPLDSNKDINAQQILGYMYQEGKGVTQNYTEAARWYKLAATQGSSYAQINLGSIYVSGRGVPQDYAEAVRMFELAAAQSNVTARVWMGYMYQEGKGVTQSYNDAVRWYKLAAAQGDSSAKNAILLIESKIEKCNSIGLKLDKDGHCVSKDYVERDDTKRDSAELQEEAKASRKYYEYKAIMDEKNAHPQKQVITPYDPSGKGGYAPEQNTSTPKTSASVNIEAAKQQCAELGFKPKTEKFGSCVLELRRSQNNKSTTIQPQQNAVQSQVQQAPRGDGTADDTSCQRYGFTPQTDVYGQCRMQIDNAKREMQAQQAQYTEQQRQYQDEVNRQRSLKQAEFWARFGSGETPNEALINTWGNGVAKPRQPPTTKTYILPGGRVMSCTTTGDITSCL